MICDFSVKNFRSLIDVHTNFEKLSVLVGANGTGKSNIIKSLKFLSIIPQKGIDEAVIDFGGFYSLIPKRYSDEEAKTKIIEFSYSFHLAPPTNWPVELLPIKIEHDLKIQYDEETEVKILKEKVTFYNAFAYAYFNNKYDSNENSIKIPKALLNGKIELSREDGKSLTFFSSPKISKDNVFDFFTWIGLGFPADRSKKLGVEFAEGMFKVLEEMVLDTGNRRAKHVRSLLDFNSAGFFSSATQLKKFSNAISFIDRYDFSNEVLRKEQQITTNSSISFDGKNLPSVARNLKKKNPKAFNRVINTLKEINPFIKTTDVHALVSGKEFVNFFEYELRREVESWEASDGTLRTLAILLALETHPKHSTIIIEEPEQNLHPWAVRSIISHVRQVSNERDIQVIITTHSQQLLECVEAKEVFVVTRSISKSTVIKKITDLPQFKNVNIGDIGRLWVKGLLGGVPDYE